MTGQPTGIKKLTSADTKTWGQIENTQIFGGEVIEPSDGYRMGAAYWRFDKLDDAPIPAPYDEVWIVCAGALSIRHDGDGVTAETGEVILVPRHTPGVAEGTAGTVVLTVAHPPSWQVDEAAWQAARTSTPGDVRGWKPTTNDLTPWGRTGDPEVFMANLAAGPAGFGLGLTFGRLKQGASTTRGGPDVTYDELLTPTRGSFAVYAAHSETTIQPGEFVYLPAGHGGTIHALDDAEIIMIQHPGARS
ncbi:hypothetical protein [Phytoactinopolyspora limicola]|uniref:hypothetical protein n=1 Tax=Phytoactinopolyspora limicola TaxID=2715536 RepID=UPI00140DE9FA|nr:hypothetical protein [Phytoactinopolyspora limicola]